MNDSVRAALERYLLVMGDDELVLGYRDTEWTGVAPMLEEDIAFSSIGQDELGHARLWYSLWRDLTGMSAEAPGRLPEQYTHACLLEHTAAPRYADDGRQAAASDWAFALVRQYLYDRFDAERLEALRRSSWEPLAAAVDKVQREEKYHLLHTAAWLDRLATAAPPVRGHLEQALERAWPDALGVFEPVVGEHVLVEAGILAAPGATLRDRWLDAVVPALTAHGLAAPARRNTAGSWELLVEPRTGGRQGQHTAAWRELWEEMTQVSRLDPAASW